MSRVDYESLSDAELARRIRIAMGEGCIRPVHVYDMVDVLLSRIEKPAGDGAAMREALKKVTESAAEIMERVRHKDGLAFNTANYIADVARTALSAPPRNCDPTGNGPVPAV